MQVSARILGQDYGLTAEEMNRILVKQGFLQGKPCDYSMTQKALQYAVEKSFHRGTGGYECYNAYWKTRTFDDSIKEALVVTDDVISEVRSEITADRAARYAARAQSDKDFLVQQAAEKLVALKAERLSTRWKTAGKIGLIVGGVILVGYGIYKVTPKVKRWWEDHKSTSKSADEAT